MASRYTDTDKWSDNWFSNLSGVEKLLFNYLCDNCDIAGFIEINIRKWTFDIGFDNIEGALKGLERGLIYSNDNTVVFLKNFLKHQKNLPLNYSNMAHKGIYKRYKKYELIFDNQIVKDIFNENNIKGASKGLISPIGNSISNSIGNGKEIKKGVLIKTDFPYDSIYIPSNLQKLRDWYEDQNKLIANENYTNLIKVLFGENKVQKPLYNVLQIQNQITPIQLGRIFDIFDKNNKELHNYKLSDILCDIDNWDKCSTKKHLNVVVETFLKNKITTKTK